MKQLLAYAVYSLLLLASVRGEDTAAGSCHSVFFDTGNVHLPFQTQVGNEDLQGLFQLSLQSLSESVIVPAVIASGFGGLELEQQGRLTNAFQHMYASIQNDPDMKQLESVLPYCLSSRQQTQGHYFLHLPEAAATPRRTIVFLHGFGGNFLFNFKVLKDAFPDCVLILPSWGASWGDGNAEYLFEVLADVRKRFSVNVDMPQLMAISGGGGISFEIYNDHPQAFSDLVVLASIPRRRTMARVRESLTIRMINGSDDVRFPIRSVRSAAKAMATKVDRFSFDEIPADHFFFVTHQKEWTQLLKKNDSR